MIVTIFIVTLQVHAKDNSVKITIDHYPYIGSLGDSAANVENLLAQKASAACGGLSNVAFLDNVVLQMVKTYVPEVGINVSGVAAARLRDAIFVFGYPRVSGSAEVFCKN